MTSIIHTFFSVYETLEQAAKALDAELRKFSWFISVGVGEDLSGTSLFVYVRSQRHRELTALKASGWQGFPIVVRTIGNIQTY